MQSMHGLEIHETSQCHGEPMTRTEAERFETRTGPTGQHMVCVTTLVESCAHCDTRQWSYFGDFATPAAYSSTARKWYPVPGPLAPWGTSYDQIESVQRLRQRHDDVLMGFRAGRA